MAFYWWMGDPASRERLSWRLAQLVGKKISGLQINYAHSDTGGLSYGLTDTHSSGVFTDAWDFAQGQNLLSLHGLYYSTQGGYWE